MDSVQKDHSGCSHPDQVYKRARSEYSNIWARSKYSDIWARSKYLDFWARCRAWAKNIPHSKTDPLLGGVHMELMMDWCLAIWCRSRLNQNEEYFYTPCPNMFVIFPLFKCWHLFSSTRLVATFSKLNSTNLLLIIEIICAQMQGQLRSIWPLP